MGSNNDTQPMPRPSARAASQRFWIAQDSEARSICGRVRRPKMKRSRPSIRQATSSSALSSTPSTLSRMNSSPRSPSASAVRSRSASTSARIRRRSARSLMRMNRHGCIRPTLGAWCAASSRRASSSGATLPPLKWRMSRRSAMARYTAARSTALKAWALAAGSGGIWSVMGRWGRRGTCGVSGSHGRNSAAAARGAEGR